jgi:hypothetical protein
MPEDLIDPRLLPDSTLQTEYVQRAEDFFQHFENSSQAIWNKTLDWWDLFLARRDDPRDQVDELWRANLFVPLPFTATRTKVAQLTEHIANSDPVWQTEARREGSRFYDQTRPTENLVQYAHEQNKFRKFMVKLMTSRSVQGTAYMKVVWTRRSHQVTLYATQEDYSRFIEALQMAQMSGAPQPPDYLKDPEGFKKWRDLVNKAQRFGYIPAPPVSGPRQSMEYEGPLFQEIPIWHLYLDPMVDEMQDQKFIIHRMVKPLSYVLARADDLPPGQSNKPYFRTAVESAMHGWDGQVLNDYEQQLAEKLGLNPQRETHPYLEKAVEMWEIWSPEEPFKYSILMNRKAVINKMPQEFPLLTTHPNIFAVRNIIVPGHHYGLSDYQEPESLFTELNKFRNLRQDGATLATLPVFVKQAGLALGDALRKLRPGMVLSVPGAANAVTQLIRHQVPPEAYREPPELKEEITDATEVPPYMKGEQAQVGRVTGTEFQGRSQQALLKYKVDASFVEDELQMLPPVILSFFAQVKGNIRQEIGGDPDALIDLSKDQLIQGLQQRFRFRGVTRAIDEALQIQELMQMFQAFGDVLLPAERRFGLQMIMEMMDVRGWSKVVTAEGTQTIAGAGQAQAGAENAQAGAAELEGKMATEKAPAQLTPEQARAMGGGGGGGAQ